MDEKAFLAAVEAAGPDEFADLLLKPDVDRERALRSHFGDARYDRMHALALRRNVTRSGYRMGNVVVLHGIMGSELAAVSRSGASAHLWVNALRIMQGRLSRLRLSEEGREEYDSSVDVRATGMMKRHYGELLLSLAQDWNVRAFWYDWRKDLRIAAAQLDVQIRGWFDEGSPVHLVAHSMGGLVARTYILNHRDKWEAMEGGGPQSPARLIMLGTPNHGSYAIPQVIAGVEPLVRKLKILDLRNDLRGLQTIFNSFVGSYQMLPSPLKDPAADALYRAQTYAPAPVSQRHLDTALAHHKALADVVDERMCYVAGDAQATVAGLPDLSRLNDLKAYSYTYSGDGRVPHELGRLEKGDIKVGTFYVKETHGDLPANAAVLSSLTELLVTGDTDDLRKSAHQPARVRAVGSDDAADAYEKQVKRDETVLLELTSRLRVRAIDGQPIRGDVARPNAASNGDVHSAYVTYDERRAEEILTRDLLALGPARPDEQVRVPLTVPKIALSVVHGRIDKLEDIPRLIAEPPDALAVGHYTGVKPQAAERALDMAISPHLTGREWSSDRDLVLTQYSERGTLRGELGQPFFLPDPRSAGRIIVVVGMGLPARFGAPELAVLARETCWSVARLGKRHLATVLIGSGNGNLPVGEAVMAWLRGIRNSVSNNPEQQPNQLARLTFVEADKNKVLAIQAVITAEQERLRHRLDIDFQPLTEAELEDSAVRATKDLEVPQSSDPIPTRITVGVQGSTYEFGAITADASIPERRIPLDPLLVEQANDELAAEWDPTMQAERGQLLGRLLVPADLRSQLQGREPIVLSLDATTARIHWELVVRPEAIDATPGLDVRALSTDLDEVFLGTSRGLTRQLRTVFAPTPEPPPPRQRVLRVLVVADPAEDMPLTGAQEEGIAVADLFEMYNRSWENETQNRVEVKSLIGPRQATRTNVLRHLMLRSYDVLHFAGHCTYDVKDPTASGWIFSGGARLTANELNRIDRVPTFVFSNACESGKTPDRAELRSPDLAPSFAESFFARGVTNFVCTAWPVDDDAARTFAVKLYQGLLGLAGDGKGHPMCTPPLAMHEAMRDARRAASAQESGARTWGAYQHYGSPYMRLFSDSGGDHATDQASHPAEVEPPSVEDPRLRREESQAKPDNQPPPSLPPMASAEQQ